LRDEYFIEGVTEGHTEVLIPVKGDSCIWQYGRIGEFVEVSVED